MIAVTLLRGRRGEVPLSRLALWFGAPVLFAALVLSYSRASLLNLFVALAALLYMERARLRIGRLLAIAASCVAAGSLAAWQLFPEVVSGYWLRLVYSQFFFTQPGSVLSGRVASWQAIAAFLAAHPWHAILGIGYKTLPYSDFHRTNHRRRQHVSQFAGRDRHRRTCGVPPAQFRNSSDGLAGRQARRFASFLLRKLDLLFLDWAALPDAFGRPVHVLASASGVLLGSCDGCPAAAPVSQ